jgi:POT family proton-dependent oligopeptide transporter
MVLSPIGLSAVTTLSVPRVVGLMMGAWFLFSAFGEMIAGRLATRASITPLPDGSYDLAQALAVYGKFFTEMLWLGVGTGLVLIVLAPLLNRLTRDDSAAAPGAAAAA